MDLLSIAQLKEKSGISDATIRRYLIDFKEILPGGIRLGRGVKYPIETVQALKNINFWYQSGKSKEQIEDNLKVGAPINSSSRHKKDNFEELTKEIRALNETISEQTKAFTHLIQLVLKAIEHHGMQENILHGDKALRAPEIGIDRELVRSDAPGEPESVTETSHEMPEIPLEEQIEFEPGLCHTDVAAVQETEESTTKKPYPNNQPLLFEDELPIKANTGTLFENPPGIDEPEAYREWIDEVLLELSGDGLSNKDIWAELMERSILTPKGKEKWFPVGVHAMLNHLRLQQEETQTTNEPKRQTNESKVGSPEYGDWLFEKITELRAEGMPYGKIERYFNDKGILTVTGKKWGRNSVYAFFKKRSG